MRIDYDGRRFRPTEQDVEATGRIAVYRQQEDLLWGEFTGGRARRGVLTGTCADDGVLDFAYCLVLDSGEIISGRCHSTPTVLADGRIRLDEQWERYGPHADTGVSTIEEVR
ncbi:MAG TPA: hypothetical protein VJ851_08360 [Jatrophihabitans sp.]|nr:hypothetical protein [Jatrophihabitans sp.]